MELNVNYKFNNTEMQEWNPAKGMDEAYNCNIKYCVNLCWLNCAECSYMGKHKVHKVEALSNKWKTFL